MEFDTATILRRAADGDRRAVDELLPVVYGQLREQAGRLIGRGGRVTIQPTALVHEAYLKLMGATSLDWRSRTHFYAIAARAMGQVLRDHARERGSAKRGGERCRVTLATADRGQPDPDSLAEVGLDELNAALERLREHDARAAAVVVLRYFSGLSGDDIADVLDLSSRTVRNDWNMARAWLHRQLTKGAEP